MTGGDTVVVEKRKDRSGEGESFASVFFSVHIAGLKGTSG